MESSSPLACGIFLIAIIVSAAATAVGWILNVVAKRRVVKPFYFGVAASILCMVAPVVFMFVNSEWSSRLPPDKQGEFIGYFTAPGCFVLIGTLAAGLLFERARRKRKVQSENVYDGNYS